MDFMTTTYDKINELSKVFYADFDSNFSFDFAMPVTQALRGQQYRIRWTIAEKDMRLAMGSVYSSNERVRFILERRLSADGGNVKQLLDFREAVLSRLNGNGFSIQRIGAIEASEHSEHGIQIVIDTEIA